MTAFIFGSNSIGAGYRADMTTYDHAFIAAGVTVGSSNATAIYGSGASNSVNVQGYLSGGSTVIDLGSSTAALGHDVIVGKTAYVSGATTTIGLSGYGNRIVNDGSIWSDVAAISISSNYAVNSNYATNIRNSGEIFGSSFGIYSDGSDGISLTNTGTIESNSSAFRSNGTGIDRIVNSGTMIGRISLGAGNDSYEGSKGHVTGSVYGEDGQDTITGGVDDDFFYGDAGNDDLFGGGGDDRLYGGADSDELNGDAGNDDIEGGAGDDRIYGGTGADSMSGGEGDDYFFVDNLGDRVLETVGQGIGDVILSTTSYTIEAGVEIEALAYLPATTAANSIAVKLTGNAFGQSILGGNGNDVLDGGGGVDTLTGYAGNDTYVTNGGDTIVEGVNGGIDTVRSTATITLSANVEKLILAITGNGTGNTLANTMTGGAGANSLNGLAGNDVISGLGGNDRLFGGLGVDRLSGGTGADTFLFNTALAGGNIDTITDFRVVDDIIHLENSIFTGLGAAGVLSAAAFASNTTGFAGDASDRIIYETDTGRLYYDADGTGSAGRTQFALLTDGLALNRADFLII